MTPATSAFLNVLRITAASVVFFNHCAQFWSPEIFTVTAPIAHSAVVVFFVLSGYVIACSTLVGDRDSKRFVVARLSRLYSVVIPALLLTVILQTVGSSLNPQFYAEYSRGFDGLRYVLTGCFLQNVWFFSASPPTNAPFWSLSYEFWYYTLFGVAVFIRRPGARLCALIALSLLIGPNILLLMPCWLVGVALFSFRAQLATLFPKRPLAFLLSLGVMFVAIALLPPYPLDLANKRLLYSGAFLSDWTTALTVSLSIITFNALQLPPPPEFISTAIRYCADHTFSLYLYHFPLIAFATATIPFSKTAFVQVGGIAVCVVLITLLLSSVTETKCSKWRAMLMSGYDGLLRTHS